ncbi:hypothetical protein ES703_14273 [subsurface metagenome]
MREKYQKAFRVVMKQIQGKNLSVAMDMLEDEMTQRVKKIKKREKNRKRNSEIIL